jgi:O-antigen ligase
MRGWTTQMIALVLVFVILARRLLIDGERIVLPLEVMLLLVWFLWFSLAFAGAPDLGSFAIDLQRQAKFTGLGFVMFLGFTTRRRLQFLLSWGVLGVLVAIGIYGLTGGGAAMPAGRRLSLVLEVNNLAVFAGIAFWVALSVIVRKGAPGRRVIALLTVPFIIYLVLATGSRKGFVMLLLVLAIAYFVFGRTMRRRPVWRVATAVLLVLAVAGMVYALLHSEWAWRFESIWHFVTGESDEFLQEARMRMMAAGWKMGLDHPLVGVGPSGFMQLLPRYISGGQVGYQASHSDLTGMFAISGFPGLVLYYLIYVSMIVRARRVFRNPDLSVEDRVQVGMCYVYVVLITLVSFYGMVFDFQPILMTLWPCAGYVYAVETRLRAQAVQTEGALPRVGTAPWAAQPTGSPT